MEGFVDLMGYEGLYMINKEGDVYGYKYKKILKQHINYKGYLFVHISKENNGKTPLIHRLIAIQFIPNPNNYPQIDHIDRDKKNNNINNLRWVNNSINQQNTEKRKSNNSGYKNICTEKGGKTYEGWRISIKYNNTLWRKCYSKANYTLEQVVEIRNNKYKEFGITAFD
jgi:hypothetical protein